MKQIILLFLSIFTISTYSQTYRNPNGNTVKVEVRQAPKTSADHIRDMQKNISNSFSKAAAARNSRNNSGGASLPPVLEITKPNSMNLDEIKGFVLVKISSMSGRKGKTNMIKSFKENLEQTPFQFIDGTKYSKQWIDYGEGYIYITQTTSSAGGGNFNTVWIFKNHKKRTVFAFNTTNIGITTALSKVGITTY